MKILPIKHCFVIKFNVIFKIKLISKIILNTIFLGIRVISRKYFRFCKNWSFIYSIKFFKYWIQIKVLDDINLLPIYFDLESLKVNVTQLCVTLCDPMDDTVHGILQSRILEWVAFHFSRGSSQPMNRTQVSLFAARFFNIWASREALESLICLLTSFSKIISQTCLVAQMVKRLSTMREILIRAVGWEDPLKK